MVHDECYYKALESHGTWSARAAQQTAKCRKQKGIVRKTEAGKNLKRWEKEKWTEQDGSPCGSGPKGIKKCRPSKRISSKTPVSWNEMSSSQEKKAMDDKRRTGMGKKASPIRRSPRGDLEPTKKYNNFFYFSKMNLKLVSYFVILALCIAATVLIFENDIAIDTSTKPVLEGLTVALVVLAAVGTLVLFRQGNVKNMLMFEVANVLLLTVAVIALLTIIRDKNFDIKGTYDTGYVAVIGVTIFLSAFILLDDLLNLGVGLGRSSEVKKSKR